MSTVMIVILWLLSFLSLILGFVVFWRQMKKSSDTSVPLDSLPTVSLLIPARDETHSITRALHNALSLDYPKLEIIVLDDRSHDSTPEKIRSFAHDGVRFISGRTLPEGWIGKNWACHQLSEHASGEYIIFCDADVFLRPGGLNRIIKSMHSNQALRCLSVLPVFEPRVARGSLCFPLLHWLITLGALKPFAFFGAFGGLMVFKSDSYRSHGGFSHYKSSMLPEYEIARDFQKRQGFASFVAAADDARLFKDCKRLIDSRVRYLSYLYSEQFTLGSIHALLLLVFVLAVTYWEPLAIGLILFGFLLATFRSLNRPLLTTLLFPALFIVEAVLLILSFLTRLNSRTQWKQRQIT